MIQFAPKVQEMSDLVFAKGSSSLCVLRKQWEGGSEVGFTKLRAPNFTPFFNQRKFSTAVENQS